MRYGYYCEDDDESVWPATTKTELQWLANREHIVREVASHVQSGLDSWIVEGLQFLDDHGGHSVTIRSRRD